MSNSMVSGQRHEEVAALMPWYVNETLGEPDRAKFEQHLLVCGGCREELAVERRIREAMSVEGALEFMPAASLNRLRSRLYGEPVDDARQAITEPRSRWSRRPQWAMAASLAVGAAAAALLVGHWRASPERPGAPEFHTVTDSVPRPRDEVVRAVFAPTITLVELQALLEEAQLRIVSGPTEAGVYSLAVRSNMPVSTSLALLRRHSSVRFAESTEPSSAGQAAEPSSAP